jgi:hypothetical protein
MRGFAPFRAHQLAETGRFSRGYRAQGLGSYVARRKPRAARAQNYVDLPGVGPFHDSAGDLFDFVRHNLGIGNCPANLAGWSCRKR